MKSEGFKVLHIITGLGDGGAEASLYRLCCFDKQNSQTVISLMDDGKYGTLLRDIGVPVYGLGMPKGQISLRGICKLWRLIRQVKPDVVQTWMYHADLLGGIVARTAGIRAICWGIRHTDVHPVKTKLSTRWVVRICAVLSRWLPVKIVCCASNAVLVHQLLGYPVEKCVVIPNGYDLDRFRPDVVGRLRLRHELGIADTLPLIGMVARFDPQKDHGNLIEALDILKKKNINFRCVLIGKGLTENNVDLSTLIHECNLDDRVELLGARNDIPSLMNALDINVLSSAFGEAFPNVLAEAMACGTPCVTTDVGDAALIVAETGWVVPTLNKQALAEALNEAILSLTDQTEWRIRQQQCRDRIVENFSIEKTVQAYRQIWQECRTT